MATDKTVAVKPASQKGSNGAGQRSPAPTTRGNGPVQRAGKYLQEVRTELRKTTWPTRAETTSQTQLVIGLLIAVGIFIASWDFLLGQILNGILRLVGVGHAAR
jgi:preprotein translocase SecE subunit